MDTHHRAVDQLAHDEAHDRDDTSATIATALTDLADRPLRELDEHLSMTIEQARNIC